MNVAPASWPAVVRASSPAHIQAQLLNHTVVALVYQSERLRLGAASAQLHGMNHGLGHAISQILLVETEGGIFTIVQLDHQSRDLRNILDRLGGVSAAYQVHLPILLIGQHRDALHVAQIDEHILVVFPAAVIEDKTMVAEGTRA